MYDSIYPNRTSLLELTRSLSKDMKSDARTGTLKFLCSYGGKILPRQTDGKLRYVGGFTRVLAVERSISFSGSYFVLPRFVFVDVICTFCFLGVYVCVLFRFVELMVKLGEFCGSSVTLKCQLPGGDLETLISVRSDEDLANIVEEYDRASSSLLHPLKIRAILSPPKSLKQISPPSSVDSTLPNSPCYGVDSLPNSPQYGINDRISSPSYRFIRRIPSPPSKYFVGPRNCHGRTCCHGSPRFLYSGPHCTHWN